MSRGFTLIEIVIYMGLFGLLMGGAVVAANDVFESSGRGGVRAVLGEEGDFILSKINWALRDAARVIEPHALVGCSASSSALIIETQDTRLTIDEVEGSVQVLDGISSSRTINAPDTKVSNLSFLYCAGRDALEWERVEAQFDLTSLGTVGLPVTQSFRRVFYLRAL